MNAAVKAIIKKFVWPFLRPLLKRQAGKAVGGAFDRLRKSVADRFDQMMKARQVRKEAAEEMALKSDENAEATSDPIEAEKQRAIAAVWREVAESTS
jgi:hypothetical protein